MRWIAVGSHWTLSIIHAAVYLAILWATLRVFTSPFSNIAGIVADIVLFLLPHSFPAWSFILPLTLAPSLLFYYSKWSRPFYPFFRLFLPYRWLGDVILLVLSDFAIGTPLNFYLSGLIGLTIRTTAMWAISYVLHSAHLIPAELARQFGVPALVRGLVALTLSVPINFARVWVLTKLREVLGFSEDEETK
ncbi:hypothetical protein PAPYR_602 [Paratrimastix pyriformis]|uniref:Rod shape-determining protein MreD n=1 Tax=Paratrimastix pyriformis TaxID=342808 RepID=A0ABQ8UU08_9EUKA|nr:hypothetical protein PAPYR_602 [Paratrimastix pyriformis]